MLKDIMWLIMALWPILKNKEKKHLKEILIKKWSITYLILENHYFWMFIFNTNNGAMCKPWVYRDSNWHNTKCTIVKIYNLWNANTQDVYLMQRRGTHSEIQVMSCIIPWLLLCIKPLISIMHYCVNFFILSL